MAKRTDPEITLTISGFPGKGLVSLDDTHGVPREFSLTAQLEPDTKAELDIVVDDDGSPRCTRMEIRGDEISGETVRSIALSRLLRLGMTTALWRVTSKPDGSVVIEPAGDEERRRFYQSRQPRRGSPVTDETLREVARHYRQAAEHGEPPSLGVAAAMNVSRSTAARWVKRARERGLLGPALRGRAGEAS
jgi:hypothetical protein